MVRPSIPRVRLFWGLVICQIVLVELFPVDAMADSCSASGTTYGSDTVQLSVPTAASYSLWVRVKLPVNSTDSLLLNVDSDAHCYNIGGSASTPTNTWEWIGYSDGNTGSTMQVSLSQGNHTLLFTGINSGTAIDRVEALAQTTCEPTGTGDNCLTTTSSSVGSNSGGSTTSATGPGSGSGGVSSGTSAGGSAYVGGSSFTAGSSAPTAVTQTKSGTQISAPVTIQTMTATRGVKKVEYLLNNKLLAIETVYPYSYTLNVRAYLNGRYTLTTKTFYTSGKITTVSRKILIKNPASFTQFRLLLQKYALLLVLLIAAAAGSIVYVVRRHPDGHLEGAVNAAGSLKDPWGRLIHYGDNHHGDGGIKQ